MSDTKPNRFNSLASASKAIARDATGAAGIALVVYGVHEIYAPAAAILAGGALVAIAVLWARHSR